MAETGKQWLIMGYDGFTTIYERRVDAGQLTQGQVKALLMALTAKAGLTFDEMLGAYAKRGTKIANNLLQVHREGPYTIFMCGVGPHFKASIVSRGSRKSIRKEQPDSLIKLRRRIRHGD
jgi:hypothetical protein